MLRKGITVWLTGLSGSGKSTLASSLSGALDELNYPTCILDGDVLRGGLCSDLDFSFSGRVENMRRVGEAAILIAHSGVICIVSLISPYHEMREKIRSRHRQENINFFEVYLSAPLEVCEQRDPKGLYKKARNGQLTGFTGIDDPYEIPVDPDIVLPTHRMDCEGATEVLLKQLFHQALDETG